MRAALLLGVFFFRLPAPARADANFPPIAELMSPVPELPIPREELRDALSDRPSLESFRAALESRDPSRRRDAVAAFGTPGNVAAIPYISAILMRLDESPAVRVSAAEALGRIADRRACSFLAQGMLDFDERVRFASALALGRIDAEANVARLEKTLRTDVSWWVRYAAAAAMGGTGKTFTVGWLERAACEDAVWQVRFQAVAALGQLGTPRAAVALGRALRDPEGAVRSAAALALGRIGGGRSAYILGRALVYEEDIGVRAILAKALRKAGGSR